MAGRPRSIDNTKVFDVAKPGKSRPMGTSRPVITSHAAPIKDPTVIDVSDSNEQSEPLSPPSVTRKVIKPMDATELEAVSAPEADKVDTPKLTETVELATAPVVDGKDDMSQDKVESVTKTDKEVTEPSVEVIKEIPKDSVDSQEDSTDSESEETSEGELAEKATDSAEQNQDPDTSSVDPKTSNIETAKPKVDDIKDLETSESEGSEASEAASVDALAEASEKPKQDQKLSEEEVKKAAALQEMIDSKKYFVPLAHDGSKQKTGTGSWVFMLVLLLIAVGAYLAIDSKIINNNINLPIHVFKQKQVANTEETIKAAPSISLAQSGLKIAYASSIWSPETPLITDQGSSVSLLRNDKTKNSVSITANELKTATPSETPSTVTITFQSAEKIPAGGKTDLYLATYVRSYTLKDKGTFFQPEVKLSADSQGEVTRIAIIGKDYTLGIFAYVTDSTDTTPVRFTTLAEAQDWFKTSTDYKQIRTVYMGMKY